MQQKTYSVIIVEDELPARKLLSGYLTTFPELKITATARNGEQALKLLSENSYDLAFMDIDLPVITGIEVLENLTTELPYLIFTTGHDSYAVRAFELGGLDYLLKPYSAQRFKEAIVRFKKVQESKKKKQLTYINYCLAFKENYKQHLIAFEDIVYISSHSKHSVIHTKKKEFETAMLLKDIQSKLPENMFLRIHKQFIINFMYLSKLQHDSGGQYLAQLRNDDETSLPVGKKSIMDLKNILKI